MRYLSHGRAIPAAFNARQLTFFQPLFVSNSYLSLKKPTFGSRDIVGHAAVRLAILMVSYRWSIIATRLSCTVTEI